MEREGAAPDDLNLRLRWPGDDTGEMAISPPAESATEGPDAPLRRHVGEEEATREEAAPPAAEVHPQPPPPPPTPVERIDRLSDERATALAAGIGRLSADIAEARGRVEVLTDATVTLREFVNERMAEIGDAVHRSQSAVTDEIANSANRSGPADLGPLLDAIDRSRTDLTRQGEETNRRVRNDLSTDVEGLLDRTRDQLVQEISGIVSRATRPVGAEVAAALQSSNTEIADIVERVLTRYQAQATRQIDEAFAEARSTTLQDTEAALTRVQEHVGRTIDEATRRLQAQTTRQGEATDERLGEALTALSTAAQETTRLGQRVERLDERVGTDLETSGRRLTEAFRGAVAELGASTQESAERTATELTSLQEAVADALGSVADRLEGLVARNGSQEDVVEAVADALDDLATRVDEVDQSGRSRHERLLAAVNEQRMAVRSAAVDLGPVSDTLVTIEAAVEDLGRSVTQAAASPGAVERSLASATGRLEERIAEVRRVATSEAERTQEKLDQVEDTLGRLAAAQAEDLEQIVDSVDRLSEPTDRGPVQLAEADAERLSRMERDLRSLSRQRADNGNEEVLEQIKGLAEQVTMLRRRMSVRARPLDDDAITALADAVAARLAERPAPTAAAAGGEDAPAPAPAPAKARTRSNRPPRTASSRSTRSRSD